MTVDEDSGAVRFCLAAGNDNGMPGSFMEFRLQANVRKFPHQEIGAVPHILSVTAVGGDARETEEIKKLSEMGRHGGGLRVIEAIEGLRD
jgi:hypothetical protein